MVKPFSSDMLEEDRLLNHSKLAQHTDLLYLVIQLLRCLFSETSKDQRTYQIGFRQLHEQSNDSHVCVQIVGNC